MSLKIIKAGILDTMQDAGRYSCQYLGINPGGVMDRFAASIVNILVGNNINEAVIEMHFPAAAFLIEQPTIIAVGGADFLPTINGEQIPLLHPILVNKNSVLQFEQLRSGARCYLAIKEGLQIPEWLGSYSTNLKANAGGYNGRALKKDDVIKFKKYDNYSKFFFEKDCIPFHWQADTKWKDVESDKVFVLPGNEWNTLDNVSQYNFLNQLFTISPASDKMGYRMRGSVLITNTPELVSSAVSFGTIQLLPDGQLIILMADHQTAGGYPRVAHIVTAHLSRLAQLKSGDKINFKMTDITMAEKLLIMQQQHLLQLQNACTFKLQEFLNK